MSTGSRNVANRSAPSRSKSSTLVSADLTRLVEGVVSWLAADNRPVEDPA